MTTPEFPLAPFRRVAWFPETKAGDGEPATSKFSGMPWLAPGEDWPLCQNCQQPMQLFVQLDLQSLPNEESSEGGDRFGSGLLQLFYCTTDDGDTLCDCDCEGWSPFSTIHLTRIVQPKGAPAAPTVVPQQPFPAKQITGWKRASDYPSWDEANQLLNLSYGLEAWEELIEQIGDEVPHPGDKLGGWPCWVQGVEYPNCPICNELMTTLVFQIDSEDNLPFMFGDVGCSHITQCPTHKAQLGFGWACG